MAMTGVISLTSGVVLAVLGVALLVAAGVLLLRGKKEAKETPRTDEKEIPIWTSSDVREPRPRLDLNVLSWQFGTSGEAGFPCSEAANLPFLRVHVHFTATHEMLIESVTLELMGNRIVASDWPSQTIMGFYHEYLYFGIPNQISKGEHPAQVFAFACGREWPSPIFSPGVP